MFATIELQKQTVADRSTGSLRGTTSYRLSGSPISGSIANTTFPVGVSIPLQLLIDIEDPIGFHRGPCLPYPRPSIFFEILCVGLSVMRGDPTVIRGYPYEVTTSHFR